MVRRSIGFFDLDECIQRDDTGQWWRGRDTSCGREVAIRLATSAGGDDQASQRLLREARAAARLKHPSIAAVRDAGRDGDEVYVVSDAVAGQPLAQAVAEKPLAPRDAALICAALADAVHTAHCAGFVHLQLQSERISLTEQGVPVIDGFRMSTEPRDRRADIAQLGKLLADLLAAGGTGANGARADGDSRNGARPPRGLEAICSQAADELHAYRTAGEMAEDLRRFLAGERPTAKKPGVAQRAVRWSRRHPGAAAGISVVLLSLIPLVPGALRGGRKEAGPPVVQATTSAAVMHTVRLATEPAGAKVAFIPRDERTGEPLPERIIHAPNSSPVELQLEPGDYLVVAVLDDGRFHEVFRMVPEDPNYLFGELRHIKWSAAVDGAVQLPRIKIPSNEVMEGMALLEGSDEFLVGSVDLSHAPTYHCAVPAYYLDPHEVSISDFQRVMWGALPVHLRKAPPPASFPVTYVSYDQAVDYAEAIGKRLPDEAEFEFAATNHGENRFPWGDDSSVVQEPLIGPIGRLEYDRVVGRNQVVITGLFSNAVEWTSTWGNQRIPERGLLPSGQIALDVRILKGGPSSAIRRESLRKDWLTGPRTRAMADRRTWEPGVGFRCARSVRPRLTPEDFVRELNVFSPQGPEQQRAANASSPVSE